LKKELAGVILGAILAVTLVQVVPIVFKISEPPLLMAAKETSFPDQRDVPIEGIPIQPSFRTLQLGFLPLALLIGVIAYIISKRRIE